MLRRAAVLFVLLLSSALMLAAPLPQGARAATITVTNLNDSGPGSLRQAIQDASTGDTINFAVTGTITLTSGQIYLYTGITISSPDAGTLSISGNNSSPIFSVYATDPVHISDVTLRDGLGGPGGAIYIGASASVTLDRVIVRDNASNSSGGGIYNGGTLAIRDSTVSGNTIVSAANSGGGIFNQESGTLEITGSTIASNYASSEGGGIYNRRGQVTITNSTITGNTAGSNAYGGGGITTAGTLDLTNVTITGNHGLFGGGIYNFSWLPGVNVVNMRNTIIFGNTAGTDGPDCMNTINSLGHNLVGNMSGCGFTGDTAGNLIGVNPRLGSLAANGGVTRTHALLQGSPAIDAGDNTECPSQDQRGIARPQGAACDIGAYEATGDEPSPRTQGDVDCDGDVDSVDSLKQLRHVAGLSVSQEPGCPAIGSGTPTWGDVDCDDDVDSVDALKVLRHVAGLPVQQNEPCTDVGEPI